MSRLTADNIRAFVGRDWQRVDESKALYWKERKSGLGPAEGIRVADELRRQVLAQQPDWPSAEERGSDLATHQRVAEMLARVGLRPR